MGSKTKKRKKPEDQQLERIEKLERELESQAALLAEFAKETAEFAQTVRVRLEHIYSRCLWLPDDTEPEPDQSKNGLTTPADRG